MLFMPGDLAIRRQITMVLDLVGSDTERYSLCTSPKPAVLCRWREEGSLMAHGLPHKTVPSATERSHAQYQIIETM